MNAAKPTSGGDDGEGLPAGGDPTLALTDAHWQAAAAAVTTSRSEAIQVAQVAHAIAAAEHRGAEKALDVVDVYAYLRADRELAGFLHGARAGIADTYRPDRHETAQNEGARP